jgi:hypothetical protein
LDAGRQSGRGGTAGAASGVGRRRGCDVLVEEAWREAKAQHERAEAQREAEEWCGAEMQRGPTTERARQRRDVRGGGWVARGREK